MLMDMSPLNTVWSKLPAAQLSTKCFTTVIPSNIHSSVTSLVKWNVQGCQVYIHFRFMKKGVIFISDST